MLPLSDNLAAARIAEIKLQSSAHNTANLNTDGFEGQRVSQSTGPGGEGLQAHISPTHAPAPVILRDGQLRVLSNTELTREAISHVEAAAAFRSNMGVMHVQDKLTEAVLEIVA
ncbi:MAG: hypothetical protein QF464_01790 [Myxococcota bacterium]|jgi:hypothetical protein|nr:hypothetical protein [Myxococcota bacterium]